MCIGRYCLILAVGAAAGAAVALMFAPQSGERTRRQIKRNARDAGDYVRDAAQNARDALEDAASRMSDCVTDLAEKARSLG